MRELQDVHEGQGGEDKLGASGQARRSWVSGLGAPGQLGATGSPGRGRGPAQKCPCARPSSLSEPDPAEDPEDDAGQEEPQPLPA